MYLGFVVGGSKELHEMRFLTCHGSLPQHSIG